MRDSLGACTEFPGRCCSIKPAMFFLGASLEVDCWYKSEHTWHRSWSQASRYPASVYSHRAAISAGSPLVLFLAQGAGIHQDLFLNPSSPRWVVPLAWQPRDWARLSLQARVGSVVVPPCVTSWAQDPSAPSAPCCRLPVQTIQQAKLLCFTSTNVQNEASSFQAWSRLHLLQGNISIGESSDLIKVF